MDYEDMRPWEAPAECQWLTIRLLGLQVVRAAQGRPVFLLLPSPALLRWPLGKGCRALPQCRVSDRAAEGRRELHVWADHRKPHRKRGLGGFTSEPLFALPHPLLQDLVLQVMCMVYGCKFRVTRDMSVSRPTSCFALFLPESREAGTYEEPHALPNLLRKGDPTAGYQHLRNAGAHPDATHRVLLGWGVGLCVLLWLKNIGFGA